MAAKKELCLCGRDQDGVCRKCRAHAKRYARWQMRRLVQAAKAEAKLLAGFKGWCDACRHRDLDRAFAEILRTCGQVYGPDAAVASYTAFTYYMGKIGIQAHPLMDAAVKPARRAKHNV